MAEMTINYRGTVDNAKHRLAGRRFAEFSYEDHEEERFFKIADYLKQQGWNIDTGVYNWAAIEVSDREEYEAVLDDWKEAKKLIKK